MPDFTCLPFDQLTVRQLYDIMALRQTVFVVEQNCPYLDADGHDLQAWHLMGRDDAGNLVAYARLLPKDLIYEGYLSLGRVVTAPHARGRQAGRKLMETCLREMERIFGKGPIKISAQAYLIRFYESLGFISVGEEYMEDGIPHMAMVRG